MSSLHHKNILVIHVYVVGTGNIGLRQRRRTRKWRLEEMWMESAGGSANCKVVNVVLVILVLFICQCGIGNIGPIYL